MDQQKLERQRDCQQSHRTDKNDPLVNREERRNSHEGRERDILEAGGKAKLHPTFRDLKSQCQITAMQMVRFAFNFPQGHFISLSWEIYGHLHIRKARLSKQYQCENPMTFSRGSLGKSWACFQSRNHFLHVSSLFSEPTCRSSQDLL